MTCLHTINIPMDIANSMRKNKFLQASPKIANSITAIVGIAILSYSTWMFLICHRDYREYVFSSWFLWTCIGVGSIFCFIAYMGYEVVAATRSALLLSCYTLFMFLVFLTEILVMADVFLDVDWEKDFPLDPIEMFDDFVDYVESNFHIFQLLTLLVLFSQMVAIANGLHISRTLHIRKDAKCKKFKDMQKGLE